MCSPTNSSTSLACLVMIISDRIPREADSFLMILYSSSFLFLPERLLIIKIYWSNLPAKIIFYPAAIAKWVFLQPKLITIMQWIDYLGLFGAFLSSITFVPQVYKAWKTRSTGDLSYWMLFILLMNVSTWLIYGIVKKDLAIMIANSIILALAFLLLYFKISFKK